VHPGVVTIPAVIGLGYEGGVSGRAALEAVIIGYETVIAVARACHPDLRQRGFHPTGATGVFGAAAASARMLGLSSEQISHALGIAASSAAGLFAFINGGADIKRLHAGHAAREGYRRKMESKVHPMCSKHATALHKLLRSAGMESRAASNCRRRRRSA
jgi:2-methylcitrate dehydratase PrpD